MDGNKVIIILDILAFLLLTLGITLIILAKKKQKRILMIKRLKEERRKEKELNDLRKKYKGDV